MILFFELLGLLSLGVGLYMIHPGLALTVAGLVLIAAAGNATGRHR